MSTTDTTTPKRGRVYTNLERIESARNATKSALTRELVLVAILSRIWPSYLCPPRRPDARFPWLVVLETPADPLVWRVSDEEAALFSHLDRRTTNAKVDGSPLDKMATLLLMASEGWE